MRFFENLFDPFTPARGRPPSGFWAFMRWAYSGTGRAIKLQAGVSVAFGLSDIVAAWCVGLIVDRVELVGAAGFFSGYGLTLALIIVFMLVIRPLIMMAQAGMNTLALGPGLTHIGIWRLHNHTLGQDMAYFENDFTGRLAQKQMQTATALGDVVMESLNALTFGVAMALGAIALLGAADWRLGAVLGLWLGLYVLVLRWGLPRIRARGRARAEARAGISGQLVDSLSNMATVKLFAHEGGELAAAHGALARFRHAALAFGRMTFAFRVAIAVLSGLLPIFLIGLSVWLWQVGQAGAGVIAVAALIAARLGAMSGWFSFMLMGLFSNIGTVEDGIATLARPPALDDAPDAVDIGRAKGAVAFEGVHYHYGADGGGGLAGFDLAVAPGEKLALVGRTGAGKSTALSLLMRLRDVEAGRITLDGQDIRRLSQASLRRNFAMVTQDAQMFNRSVRDNIRYGRPEADEAAVRAACEAAEALEFIDGLVDHKGRRGMDAHLGERGVRLSGGQRQRVALARAILRDAPVLLLDEATSALDSEVEAAIQDTLDVLTSGKTVIAIAHRLSTIARMDRIVVIDAGRVAEAGSHAELLATGGIYAGLWARQSGGFLGLEAAE